MSEAMIGGARRDASTADISVVSRLGAPIDLVRTLAPLRHGAGDPTILMAADGVWRATRTPEGTATVRLRVTGDGSCVLGDAWGTGSQWMIDRVPALIGEWDDWSRLDLSGMPWLAETRRRRPGLRLCRTGLVMESLVPACLEQRVTGREAFRAWRELVRCHGEPAPGPMSLCVMPSARRILEVPDWDWHRWGVDPRRYRTIQAAASVAERMEEGARYAATGMFEQASARLRMVPGVGQWTAAEVAVRAYGDPDAVSVGDFHLKHVIGYALTGAARSDDQTMLRLLEPWQGQRARIVRLIESSGLWPPKFGPRFSPNDIRAI
jgi:3-methyladenine DNA glycosylase/8-oxoguanine DNA glycosylase